VALHRFSFRIGTRLCELQHVACPQLAFGLEKPLWAVNLLNPRPASCLTAILDRTLFPADSCFPWDSLFNLPPV